MGTSLILWSIIILQFCTYHLSEGQHIPQFLKKKYGNQYGQQLVGPTKNTYSYTKTKTKTKTKSPYSGTGSQYRYNPLLYQYPTAGTSFHTGGAKTKTGFNSSGGCTSQPPRPNNAGVRCSTFSGCRADCLPNYQFPNGQTEMRFTCVNGKWHVEGIEVSSVSSCEPICSPPCQNSGICIAPNQCQCSKAYSGPQCQFENKPCINYPPMPINAARTCNSKLCTVTCIEGHEFPDGSGIITMACKNGNWVSTNEKWTSIPDCTAKCDPPCQNGGNCLSLNVCQCPQDFRGPQCQYNANACSAKKLPTNGGYNCTGDLDSFSCSISCPEGINFEFQPESVYKCLYSTGVFLPQPIPKCIFPDYTNILRQPGSMDIFRRLNGSKLNLANILGGHKNIPILFATQSPYNSHTDDPYGYTVPDEFLNETNAQNKPGGYYIRNEHQLVTVENKLPKPGSCFHWGGTHYKTFDDRVYSFESKCAHILVKDAVDNTFTIITQNHGDCFTDTLSCHKIIEIYIQDKRYFLKLTPEGIPVFGSGNKILPIPGQAPGVRIEMAAHFLVVLLDTVGVKIRWDGQNFLQVETKENLWNRTEGLCGKIDGDPANDIMTADGIVPKNIATLATSWKANRLGENCDDAPTEGRVCQDSDVKDSVGYNATKFCKKIMASKVFATCQTVVDITSLLEACRSDYCNCKEEDGSYCACETLNVYVRDCSHKGIKGLTNWRDEDTCPMRCSGGMIYKSCGSAKGQPACGAITEVSEDNHVCEEGCFCPEGTVINEGKCITKDKCPCRLRGKTFSAGSSVPKDCNTCTCVDGQWVCTKIDCGTRCSAVGDPHYVTFDGRKYDFMGQCSYYLVKSDNFSIEAENTPCAGSISQAMNFPTSISSGLPTCTKTVTIKMNGHIIKLKQNHDLVVNGQDITKVPYIVSGIKIRSVSSIFLQTKLPNGIEIWWDGSTRVYIDLPPKFREKTRGLCGTFNDNQKDDFLTPEDDIEQAVIPFANKWKTSEKCNDIAEVLLSHPCDKNIHKKATAEKYCSKIKSDLFKDCHWFVDPDQFYQDCLYDMCSCEFSVSKCLCPVISSYATECSRKNIKINWRLEVRECGIHCPGGQKYQICGNSCTRTCFDIADDPDCKPQCIEGCNCPEGMALDEDGECLPIGQCKCAYNGLDFPAGYKEVRPAPSGPELCVCFNGLWQCKEATPEEMKQYPSANDMNSKCNASANMEFTTCEQVEPVTCKTMHSPDLFTSSVCHSGCQCKKGYVLDTASKRCVKPTECPCHHGGKSYKENATVQSECNTCLCQNGKWKCTDRLCTAECSAWGDSHYKTFDGKRFDYQGQCDYILAKGSFGSDKFDITIQNVPCGSLGTTCSKSVTIRVLSGEDTDTITLEKNKLIPRYKIYKHITVRTKGLFVIVEAPELGFTVHWDRGTRVYVKVDPKWKDRTKGLCGNYNDNEADDFQTPSGGLSEVSANIFGDSWRLQSYCPDALEVSDTCQSRPDRKVWAMKKCGILKSSLFTPCHSEVPVEYFLEKCIFDSCACDQGGDCECFCTALAAYAQECNNRGVPIKWRTQALCPMQCDERCTEYSPCISTCPEETCEDLLISTKITKTCGADSCIEGCAPKQCPSGYIYSNSSMLECIPRNVCKPVCMEINNVTFYEGDLIEEDNCHSCYCSREKKICNGQPCTTTETPEYTTHQMEQVVPCKSGWSKWINREKTASVKSKRRNNRKEMETLPSVTYLSNLEGSSRCNVSNMVDIECRTADTHTLPKETGLDVECSLERGLICQSSDGGKLCPDFEIRVFCQCQEETTTTEYITESTTAEYLSESTSPEYISESTTEKPECEIGSPPKEHPTDCYKFYECAPGLDGNQYVEKICGGDMMYNPKEKVCDWPRVVIPLKKSCGKGMSNIGVLPESGREEVRPIEAEVPSCPPGKQMDSCAIECDKLCIHYSFIAREKGYCRGETKCEYGCASADKKKSCPEGSVWADENTCVTIESCLCVNNEGEPVKPGEVFEEEGCQLCQCIDNAYSCHVREDCDEESGRMEVSNYTVEILPKKKYRRPSVTPPPQCDENRLAELIPSLPNVVFNASSSLSKIFAPENAKLNGALSETSGGSWAPKESNHDQFLEIDLGKQEPVYGVVVKGGPLYDEYVTSYKVSYSPDGHDFYYILNDEDQPVVFRGSIDSSTPVRQLFETPVEAKVVRIHPETWNHGISLRVDLIGCSEEETSTSPLPTTVQITYTTTMKAQYCDDEMGLSGGAMSDQQISTSSDLSPEHSKKHLKLTDESSWQPLTNSPTEWIMFDFLEPRDVTGLATKGGKNGWVTAYTVEYSHDNINWNPILDKTHSKTLFLGNYDSYMPHVTNFEKPINARYVKIIPKQWHHNIQMRLELHGCYLPYPTTVSTQQPLTTVAPSPCNYCPGVEQNEMEMDACRCLANLWWDGENCVNKTQCPCMIGYIPYAVGAGFEKEDCSQCVCKIGGVSHCKPKKCGPCEEGLKSSVSSTCSCICQPCPTNTRLCPTSNICIDSELWCNGVQDCPDDELDCTTTTEEVPTTTELTTVAPTTKQPITTTPKPVKKCPVVTCRPGFKKILKKKGKTYVSTMMAGKKKSPNRKTYTAIKSRYNPYKGGNRKYLQRPTLAPILNETVCQEYICARSKPAPKYIHSPDECPPVVCQATYVPVFDTENTKSSKVCPDYTCHPPPEPDAVCNVTGRTFNTFDNVEYKYDICNHVLARDLESDEWDVSLKKNCTATCSQDLIIRHGENVFVIHPDMSVEYNGYRYTVEQTKSIGDQNQDFDLSQIGSMLLFVSHQYGFWIIWNEAADVKLGVVGKLAEKVDGLCGYFNNQPEDDKRKPDGSIARTSVEFGDSWALSDDQPAICEARVCPIHLQNKAWEMCNKVKDQSLVPCAKAINTDAFISRCLETICTCLERSVKNHTAEEGCRCQALQSFVVDCLSADSTVDISEWRLQQDCPATCEAPLVYHDCYQRKCEPTCESISDPNVCPKVKNICFPGCYCPSGYVRREETCIKPSSCRDCECNVLPHLKYVTYDENNFTVTGNCVYVMSRDLLLENQKEHKFQVLVTNHPCKKNNKKMCVGKITILYQNRKIHILLDEFRHKLKLIVDSERIADFSDISDWAAVRETVTKHMKMLLKDIQVEVSVYYPSLGVSVKAPSHKYNGKLEGICGNCNGDMEDDFRTPAGKRPKDENDFGLSWLYEHLPGGQSRDQCDNKEELCIPSAVGSDPCNQVLDTNKFGQCLNVLDPSLFLEWCKKDTCGGHPEQSCEAIEAYAKDCASHGFCINWRNELCPSQSCPPGQFYDPCGTSVPETCESIKEKTKNVKKHTIPQEGCYCPPGKVLFNSTCVVPKDCIVCDKEGHHPGDQWKKDACTNCTCEGTSLKCETQQCPEASTFCERGYNAIKLPKSDEECCDKFACIPEPTNAPTCEPPQKLVCGKDQILKLDTKLNGCPAFICECKPKEECEPIDLSTDIPPEPGYLKEVDESSCCPVLNMVCKKETCPLPNECPEFYSQNKTEDENKCCPIYSCEPPKNKCIYETEYKADGKGGEKALTEYEIQKVLKGANETWKDGPCRECKCILSGMGNYQPSCSVTDCPPIKSHPDYAEYELVHQPVYEQCCPNVKRVECKHDGRIYNVGEKWTSKDDYCTTFHCVDAATGVQKETRVKNCDKKCDVGFKYFEALPESKECCGSCKQVACVVDGTVREIEEEWTSDDFCVNYFCDRSNGSVQVAAVVVTCPEVPEDLARDYVIETTPIEGACCPLHTPVACKVGDKEYSIGETWPSPDGDKCKKFKCIRNENNETRKQESVETCKKDCKEGWKYVESNSTCCGSCVQVACLVDGGKKEPGESWKSSDNCTTFTCEQFNDQFSVVSSQETCPRIDDCPEEKTYIKGCCKLCNITSSSMVECSPIPMKLEKTVGLLNYSFLLHDECTNKQPIANFTECIGNCESATFFSPESGLHESVCSCCKATAYGSVMVELTCKDGKQWKKKIAVPSKCGCLACAANKNSYSKKAPIRKGGF